MIGAINAEQVVISLFDVLENELETPEAPSALVAISQDDDKTALRIRVASPNGMKWFRLSVEEFNPLKRPKNLPPITGALLPQPKK